MKCLVRKCHNHANKKLPGISFHKLPRCTKLRHKWLEAIGFDPKKPSSSRYLICSIHFEENSFREDQKSRRLSKRSAIPSMLLSGSNIDRSQVEVAHDSFDLSEEESSYTSGSSHINHPRQGQGIRAENSNIAGNKPDLKSQDAMFESFGSTVALQLIALHKLDVVEAFACMQAIQNLILTKITALIKNKETESSTCLRKNSETISIPSSQSSFFTNTNLPSTSKNDIKPTAIKQDQILRNYRAIKPAPQYSNESHSVNSRVVILKKSDESMSPLLPNSTNIQPCQSNAISSRHTNTTPESFNISKSNKIILLENIPVDYEYDPLKNEINSPGIDEFESNSDDMKEEYLEDDGWN